MVRENWKIDEIERMTEAEAQEMALEKQQIKGHDIYFVDFGGYFGYSCLVFKDGHHIHYANDYQLHYQPCFPEYKSYSKEELREIFIKKMNSILFTEEEISAPLKSYDEYTRKSYFVHNYYGMRRDYLSIWSLPKERETEEYKHKSMTMTVYDPIASAYYLPEDEAFVRHHIELYEALEAAMGATKTNFEYQKSAFLHEMYNHEYGINWQADWDVLGAFGNIIGMGADLPLEKYFDALGFNDVQRSAYRAAQVQYYIETSGEN